MTPVPAFSSFPLHELPPLFLPPACMMHSKVPSPFQRPPWPPQPPPPPQRLSPADWFRGKEEEGGRGRGENLKEMEGGKKKPQVGGGRRSGGGGEKVV